ncbi:hypothetical protein [Sphingobacterium griseoflavum]|uniref:Lipoprotein n=1 Tax=Sphingobacterium griseoflavum TaxID=1474952 RepID=A0ABQ3HZA6_9SPHI|nr:hypothetical protein [Sphingobacterium griseoflavum]GHE34166.1 hypothetical protein GCM10017764_16860 [Sphingobacterium griseoflavum]
MNRFGGKIIRQLFFTSLLILTSCESGDTKRVDFTYLLEMTPINKEEIRKIIASYEATIRKEKIMAYRYILSALPDQYRIDYKLIKEDRVIEIDSRVTIDSILALQNEGFVINLRDTVNDINMIKSDDLIRHIDNFISNWDAKRFTSDLSFESYMAVALPYRVNNEPLSACFSKLSIRYPVDKLIRQKAYNDTLEAFGKKVSNIVDCYAKNLYGVNQLNNMDADKVLSHDEKITDYEDYHIHRIQMLRHLGIPAFVQFTPHMQNSSVRPYTVKLVKEGLNIDSLHYAGASKVFISCFEKVSWRNPYDELVRLGIDLKNIPLSLYIPKMADVTSRVAKTGQLHMNIDETLLHMTADSVVYLCAYTLGRWLPVDFGIVYQGDLKFQDIGADVLYIMASFSEGKLIISSYPFTFENSGAIRFLRGNNQNKEPVSVSMESRGGELQSEVEYTLYQWNIDGWYSVKNIKKGENATELSEGAVYMIRRAADKNGKNCRPFTIADGKQVWW